MDNIIKFSTNWNNKIDCKYFTTIRLMSKKFEIAKVYNVELKNKEHSRAIILNIFHTMLDNLNDFNCYLDTGYSVEETKNIFKKMYPNVDFKQTHLAIILLKKL